MALFNWEKRKPPVKGDKRIKKRFLLTPHCIKGEYRWLGLEYIEQIYKVESHIDYDLFGGLYTTTTRGWVDHAWLFKNHNL